MCILYRYALSQAVILTLASMSTAFPHGQTGVDSRPWQQGTIQSLQLKHRGAFDPHAAEIDLEIAGSDSVIYKTTLAYEIHKVDMIPGVGIVTAERRRKKTHLNVTVGSAIRFAVSEQHGWLIDADGIEQNLIVKSAAKKP